MKRKLLSLLVLIMAVSGAWADVVNSGTCGDPNVNSGTVTAGTVPCVRQFLRAFA